MEEQDGDTCGRHKNSVSMKGDVIWNDGYEGSHKRILKVGITNVL